MIYPAGPDATICIYIYINVICHIIYAVKYYLLYMQTSLGAAGNLSKEAGRPHDEDMTSQGGLHEG